MSIAFLLGRPSFRSRPSHIAHARLTTETKIAYDTCKCQYDKRLSEEVDHMGTRIDGKKVAARTKADLAKRVELLKRGESNLGWVPFWSDQTPAP